MNKIKLFAASAALALSAAYAAPSMAAIGVSINVGEPGFYGQIDLGDAPPPQVVYAQPRLIEPVVVEQSPIYLRVPAGYERDWIHHCHQYDACGRRVYFVQDNWYRTVYAPHYQKEHGNPHDRDDHDDRGHGRGHGKGHGHGHDDDHGHDHH